MWHRKLYNFNKPKIEMNSALEATKVTVTIVTSKFICPIFRLIGSIFKWEKKALNDGNNLMQPWEGSAAADGASHQDQVKKKSRNSQNISSRCWKCIENTQLYLEK